METISRVAVMEGELDEVNLADLLQVISIGRQYTVLELRQEQAHTATLFLKSGKLISAAGIGTRGKEAFLRLFPHPQATTFHVFRTETPRTMPEPIGPIGMLLLEALDRSVSSARPAAGAAQQPRSAPAPGRTSQRPGPQRPAAEPGVGHALGDSGSPPAQRGLSSVPPVQARFKGGSSQSLPASRASVTGRRTMPERGAGCVLTVASPKGGSGKTTIALNLAVTLARMDIGVILVDGDVNGDILSSIDARGRARFGTFDVLMGKAIVDDALLSTVMPHFKILPAVGTTSPDPSLTLHDHSERWQDLLSRLKNKTDVVIVDAPSGMLGVTYQILRSSSHVLGVLQAEVVAQRSFSMFAQGLDTLPINSRPRVLGVVLNMVQPAHVASVSVLQRACSSLPKEWLFESSIPRSTAFLDASEVGLPLRLLDDRSPPAVSWLFEMLAGEVIERLRLAVPERKAQRLLI
jgi:chromosome partitioning protein